MNPYLIPALELGPVIVARIIDRIPDERIDVAAEEGRFTPRQVIAHLADWEPIDRDRIAIGLSNPGATIEAFDEIQMAHDHHYVDADMVEQCERLIREREKTVALIEGLTAQDWNKTVHHPERGTLTVADLCNLIVGHDTYHVEQLTASLD